MRATAMIMLGVCVSTAIGSTKEVYFESNGFESPAYHSGRLAGHTYWQGQDLWVGILSDGGDANLDSYTVQGEIVKSGAAAVKFDAALQSANTERAELYRGTMMGSDLRYVELTIDVYISSGVPSGEWILDQQQSAMNGLEQLGIMPDGRMRAVDHATGDVLYTPAVFERGRWHRIRTISDFLTDRMTIWLDGAEVLDVGTLEAGGMYGLVGFFCVEPGTDALYFDNLSIAFRDTVCDADLNGDGVLSIFDFLAFQTAFSNADSDADLAAPFGVFNIFDFLAFQTAYGLGC